MRDSFISDKPATAIASCIALGMSWAGLPTELVTEGERTIVAFKDAGGTFASAVITAGSPSAVDLHGQFGARIRRAVVRCL